MAQAPISPVQSSSRIWVMAFTGMEAEVWLPRTTGGVTPQVLQGQVLVQGTRSRAVLTLSPLGLMVQSTVTLTQVVLHIRPMA